MASDQNSLTFEHWRVVPSFAQGIKGRPHPSSLMRWSRKMGWLNNDGTMVKTGLFHTMKPFERGGQTLCLLTNSEGIALHVSVAHCSMSDHYNYKMGRDIARGRMETEYLKPLILEAPG